MRLYRLSAALCLVGFALVVGAGNAVYAIFRSSDLYIYLFLLLAASAATAFIVGLIAAAAAIVDAFVNALSQARLVRVMGLAAAVSLIVVSNLLPIKVAFRLGFVTMHWQGGTAGLSNLSLLITMFLLIGGVATRSYSRKTLADALMGMAVLMVPKQEREVRYQEWGGELDDLVRRGRRRELTRLSLGFLMAGMRMRTGATRSATWGGR